MHLAEACAGAGTGILIAPPLRTRVGTAVAGITGLTLLSLLVPWVPPLNPVLQATFRRVSPAPGLLWLVTGQAVVLGLACAVASTSLARARRPRLTTGRPRAAGWRGDRRPGRPRATRNSRRGTLVTEVTACSGVGETPSRR